MEEKLEKILAGEFEYENGAVSFSCPKLELMLSSGSVEEGSFSLYGNEKMPLYGMIVTNDIRMTCLTAEFDKSGKEIHYRFNSCGMEEGECLKGEFKVISNQGEYCLPYTVTIIPKVFLTSLGHIKNLFHFANLAKTDWKEAVGLFYSPDFKKIFEGSDRQYLNAYRGLCVPPECEQRVEEFLLEIRKKQPVEYITDRDSIAVNASVGVTEERITLTRNGWGYTSLQVELSGDFLFGEKEVLTDDDFLGNSCCYHLLIHNERLHAGKNMGMLRFYNEYVSIEIPVTIHCERNIQSRKRKGMERGFYSVFRLYLEYRMNHISAEKWMQETGHILNQMKNAERKDYVMELFQVQLLITQERFNEANWLLEQTKEKILGEKLLPQIRCYILYLSILCSPEKENHIDRMIDEIYEVFRNHTTNWKIAWLILYLDEECGKSPSKKWVFLEQQFEKNCTSPVWYMEAAALVRENPSFLMRLTPFVIQVLNFAAKYDYLTEDMISQIHYLAGRMKQYSERLFFILKKCYEKKADTETLQAICMLLIKGNKTGPAYLEWYREGIKKELRLTKLYEYYMMSVDIESKEEIPHMALLYFAYHSSLTYERNAYLYAYVIENREVWPELYLSYYPDMERFALNQLEKGHISSRLVYIYQNLIKKSMLKEGMIETYVKALFTRVYKVKDPRIFWAVVVFGKLKQEVQFPVIGKTAYIPVYSEDCRIFFEDGDGNRFCREIEYEEKQMMQPEAGLEIPEFFMLKHTGLLLYECEKKRNDTVVTGENKKYISAILESPEITDTYKHELSIKLLHYYFETDDTQSLDDFLDILKPEKMSSRERAEAIRCMVFRGKYKLALEWIKKYGTYGVEPKTLVRMCSRILVREEFQENRQLTDIIYAAFTKGKYDANILSYLIRYFVGMTKEMRNVWRACERFDVNSYELCERLLKQMLVSGEYVGEETDIFRQYLSGGAKTELVKAYLSHCAFRYFVKEGLTDPFVFQEMIRLYRSKEEMNDMCKLALLRFFSEKEELDETEEEIVQVFIKGLLVDKKIFFNFFRKFNTINSLTQFYHDKTVLEYRTKPSYHVKLHYMLKTENGEGDQYQTEDMQYSRAGYFVKNFVLFFGESLQYYITENRGETEKLTQSGSLDKSDTEREYGDSRFNLINDFVIADTLQDYDTADVLLEEYYKKSFTVDKLFQFI